MRPGRTDGTAAAVPMSPDTALPGFGRRSRCAHRRPRAYAARRIGRLRVRPGSWWTLAPTEASARPDTGESSPETWCKRRRSSLVGEGVGCSGRLELEDLLVAVAMGPLLEERPHRRGGQVAPADQPLVVLLDGEHRGQADQRAVVGEDPHDVG